MKRGSGRMLVAGLLLVAAGTATLWAQAPLKVGEVRAYRAETPHPYPLGTESRPVVWTDRVVSPGAEFIRVHFTGFTLANGDYVTVSSPDGSQTWTYTGKGPHGNGDIWSIAIDGDAALVQVHGGRGNGHGYLIDSVGHGTMKLNPVPEVLCGTDGRENVACHSPEIDAAQKPVSRLLFTSAGAQYLCTGSLVSGSNANTLMTNNHCIKNQTETSSLEARFNYQYTACGGGSIASQSIYFGGTFLKTNTVDKKGAKGGLDYTLLTLQGTPEASWGELIPTTKAVAVNDLIWFIQHGGGNPKTVGYWEDSNHATRCAVDAINQTYARSASGSQTAYACDSEGGSSGSPIVDPVSGHVIALHHFGGVGSNPCLNSGTAMAKICADAGALLSCVSN